VAGNYHQVFVAPREIDYNNLPACANTPMPLHPRFLFAYYLDNKDIFFSTKINKHSR